VEKNEGHSRAVFGGLSQPTIVTLGDNERSGGRGVLSFARLHGIRLQDAF